MCERMGNDHPFDITNPEKAADFQLARRSERCPRVVGLQHRHAMPHVHVRVFAQVSRMSQLPN
jgi:hypothetical protein